jgi:hypothetical protein
MPRGASDAMSAALLRLAKAEDPTQVMDPYMRGGIGPVDYHGVVHAGGYEAVVSLYGDEVRVLRISPNT